MFDGIIKNFKTIFVYSDTQALEAFQGLLLVFVTSSQLIFVDCFHNSKIFDWMGVSAGMIGIMVLFSLVKNNLKHRLRICRLYWAFYLTIIFLFFTSPITASIPIFLYYILQFFATTFTVWRLNMEHALKCGGQ